eukprot:8135845-Ditylum_brightwellii.AAC.1
MGLHGSAWDRMGQDGTGWDRMYLESLQRQKKYARDTAIPLGGTLQITGSIYKCFMIISRNAEKT